MYHVLWTRLERYLATTHDAWRGQRGRSCDHDCGPHASCRCGLCVGGGGDKNTCLLPDCEECSVTTFYFLVISVIVNIVLLMQLIFGALQVLLTMNERAKVDQSTDRQTGIWGNCCLCDPQLYKDLSTRLRHYKKSLLCKVWPVCRLPPMLLVIVTVLMIFMFAEFVLFVFKDTADDVYAIIPEELYPSDHLMLTVSLTKEQ